MCVALAALVVGWNLAGAVHELGHATAAWALGGKVLRIRPWHHTGHVEAIISHLSDSKISIILLSGLLATSLEGVGVLLAVPWSRLSASEAVMFGLILLPFAIEATPFAFSVVFAGADSDSVLFALRSGCDELLLSLLPSPWDRIHLSRLD